MLIIRNILVRIMMVSAFIGILIGVIAYARGYRPNFQQRSFTSTGILSISSSPRAAKVYINGSLKGVTDLNLTLPPDDYLLEIKKEGHTDWSKQIKLKGEIVMSIDSVLFPKNPSLSPLTSLGVVKTIPVSQTDRMILVSQNNDPLKDGIYIFDINKRPLSLMPPLKLLLLKKNLPFTALLESTKVFFSSDYRQGIFEFTQEQGGTLSYLLSLDEENTQLFDITNSKETLLTAWKEEKNKEIMKILETFPKDFGKIATGSMQLISFSPDETKILYRAIKPVTLPPVIVPPLIGTNQTEEKRTLQVNNFYIYDRKEDKNYEVEGLQINSQAVTVPPPVTALLPSMTPTPEFLKGEPLNSILWYPDSRHLIVKKGKEIVVTDYDGKNRRTVYSAPFDANFFAVTDQGKLLILTNLNPQSNQASDLYEVGIR